MLKDEIVIGAIENLISFPGIWSGLELGNVKRHQALYYNEEIRNYINYISDTWRIITLGNPDIQRAVDIITVRSLQLYTPSTSRVDREYIIREMDSSILFLIIDDLYLRERIKAAILQLNTIIPIIKSWHENIKWLGLGIRIIKNYLLEEVISTIY
jgi:hypothetical protein